jgi:sulfur-oxidizing protein SoxX
LCVLALVLFVTPAFAQEPLAAYRIVDGGIPQPLTTQPGDAARGRAIANDRQRGGCLNCHAVPNARSPGDLGPDLAGVAGRLAMPVMRLRVVDPRKLDPGSRMPAFYSLDGLVRVAAPYVGKPLLQLQDIEDVLAFLATLE